ncbi:uncharacterized protein MONBRDRAFT_14285, partial [Monosiga brevicollis MX1]
LVPGCGLGRLPWELAHRGYSSQGNEWSAYMLFASNFVLNCLGGQRGAIPVFPFAHMYSNCVAAEDQLLSVAIPDVDVSAIPAETNFSMTAGDFLESYTAEASWDGIVSCFFLDCAANIIGFIERMFAILKPGGYLFNIGPLLYHFEDRRDVCYEMSIELTWEELREVLLTTGFQIELEERDVPVPYMNHPRSMLQNSYRAVFFVARKPLV